MSMKRNVSVIAMAVASVTAMSQAQAQTNENASLEDWSYDTIYQQGGIRADNLMDTEVFGPEGEEIGSVENVLITEDNKIGAIIAQVGGFWDIGDTHVLVPWEDVELTDDGVQIPVTEDNADDYGLFDSDWITKQDLSATQQVDDDVATGSRVWKLSELLDDYASIGQGVGYGYVDNVLFSRNGEIQTVVIEADEAYGGDAYAYPFAGYGNGWQPGYTTYSLPYGEDEVGNLEPFDYDEYDGLWDI
ncbi:PRC-barrel domain-containing protein [Halomonas sp. McH1-25]|uniref:PRC-barrel domain-containing protein n=1 Tax=unclassified Halomonas TaxID=2609666 RepID=UPI001EF4C906|nr:MULTISPECIES: PRC-barrel domain-containing protein [unclassified Halomonas]MCG7599315.1 PRC-barrel domain-containing protein [Halomonas sp. McH1-25]MCP1341183.1 PRC-barrel domain-containing protein [Halomonas sp. FL8]MCP1362089.1 PRC-barrel domain-containing protein [Halomonas sp. BBD45]MCP1366062.1 PRC-barrel domain-containing protein [Halomonas sp. BBD48]